MKITNKRYGKKITSYVVSDEGNNSDRVNSMHGIIQLPITNKRSSRFSPTGDSGAIKTYTTSGSFHTCISSSSNTLESLAEKNSRQRRLYSRTISNEAFCWETGESFETGSVIFQAIDANTLSVSDISSADGKGPLFSFSRADSADWLADKVQQGDYVFVKNCIEEKINGVWRRTDDGTTQDVFTMTCSPVQTNVVRPLTDTFGINVSDPSGSVYKIISPKATPPSWTQRHIGLKHEFVACSISSSRHESTNLGAYLSGNLPLEQSVVPASGNVYFSKMNRLVTKTYAVTASAGLVTALGSAAFWPPFDRELTAARSNYQELSGVYINNTYFDPAVIDIPVPDYGRIKDIKVWVEFIHDVRTTSGAISDFGEYPHHGLQGVQIALKSPNVNFPCAYPIMSDVNRVGTTQGALGGWLRETIVRQAANVIPDATGSSQLYRDKLAMPSLLRGTYLLWAGHIVDLDWSAPSEAYTPRTSTGFQDFAWYRPGISEASEKRFSASFCSFDTDIDMRTIFTDGSPNLNPRHMHPVMPNGPYAYFRNSAGVTGQGGSAIASYNIAAFGTTASDGPFSNAYIHGINAPYYRLRKIDDAAANWRPKFSITALGSNIPWFYDPRLHSKGYITGSAFTASLGMSPPNGWIGTTISGNLVSQPFSQFNTTGSQIGVDTIRPVYPLLDDVHEKLMGNNGNIYNPTKINFNPIKSVMTRPGLRGTEINGIWQLLIGTDAQWVPASASYIPHRRAGVWFRQVRLEFLVEERRGPRIRALLFETSSCSRTNMKDVSTFMIMPPLSHIEGLATEVDTVQRVQYGRSVGITDNTASTDFAVFSRITGSLFEKVSGSASTLQAYLSNEFGTPYIPLSSGSFGDEGEKISAASVINSVVNASSDVKGADTLSAHVNRANITKTKSEQLSEKLSSGSF